MEKKFSQIQAAVGRGKVIEISGKILEVNNLNVEFDGNEVLRDLNFDVDEGEVLVILGPNGAGKTTLLRALLGLIPYRGSISWKTDDINYLSPAEFYERKNVSPLSIEEFFKLKKVNHEEIVEILEKVGLDESILEKRFEVLSSGEFQRMSIAWALVDDPSVLLFDEPTTGIDIGGQKTIYSLLHKFWKRRNLTVLLVTHDLSVVWEHASNVLCLNKRKLCYGAPERVLEPERLEEMYGTGVKYYKHDHRGTE